jgi:hypothetical protein
VPLRVSMDVPAEPAAIQCAVEGLAALSYYYMRIAEAGGAPFPPLYKSGVVYRREPLGEEQWQHAQQTLLRKQGDCEDLAAYRCAELRMAGEMAIVAIKVTGPGTYHAVVQRADGTIEDPSRMCIALERARERDDQ